MASRKTVVAVPDLHLPFTDWKRVERLYHQIEEIQPHYVIQLGDLLDRFTNSRFARSHDVMTPEEEVEEGRAGAVNFWAHIHKIAPKAKKIQLKGNHDDRLLRQVLERYPEIYSIVKKCDAQMFHFKNVQTVEHSRDGFFIDGVLYTHGHLTQLGQHMQQLGVCVVHGHTHRGGTIFRNHFGKTLWELDCGYLADEKAIPLQYGPTKHLTHVKGFGIVDDNGPRFVPI